MLYSYYFKNYLDVEKKWVNYHYTKKIFKHKLVEKGRIGVN